MIPRVGSRGSTPRTCKFSGSGNDARRSSGRARKPSPRAARRPCAVPRARCSARGHSFPGGTRLTRRGPLLLTSLLAPFLLSACFRSPSAPIGGILEDDAPPLNRAFGNVQPHHVTDPQYHDALRDYGTDALFVCNASLSSREVLDDLREIVGPDAILLANVNASMVPLWGMGSELWDAYRAAMDPSNVGLPDSAWYWIDSNGERMRAPKACPTGWCGEYWPGWALKPDTSAYRAKAEFIASRMAEFDGLFLDDWRAGFSAYQVEGLGLPPERQNGLTQQWIVCRRFYVDRLRELSRPGFRLVPNLQPARYAFYPQHEMVRFDGHTAEFPDETDLERFRDHPSPFNVGWLGDQSVPGVVREGFGLPTNVDP